MLKNITNIEFLNLDYFKICKYDYNSRIINFSFLENTPRLRILNSSVYYYLSDIKNHSLLISSNLEEIKLRLIFPRNENDFIIFKDFIEFFIFAFFIS